MIKIEKTNIVGFEDAIRGMRNPKNSWDRSDSGYCRKGTNSINCENCTDFECANKYDGQWRLGKADHRLMSSLSAGGPVHAKYRRMIIVYVDITAPLYWWKEFDTYKVGTVSNSCSTMHKLMYKKFEPSDFSHDHIYTNGSKAYKLFNDTIDTLNYYRDIYLNSDDDLYKKNIWYQMIELLPTSYNQKRTIMLSYEVLANIYESRHNHKLSEWREFCNWIINLPHSDLIVK